MGFRNKSALGVLAVVSLVLGLFSAPAAAQTTYRVEFGAEVPKGFTGRVFAPPVDGVPTIRLQKNDIVNLFGGALLLPQGQGPLAWYADHADGPDSEFAPVIADPDADQEGVTADYKFNTALFIPQDPNCGGDAATACVFDGSDRDPITGVLNGGDRFEDFEGNFFVQITANPGAVIYAMSPFAVSKHTVLRIEVVNNASGITTQAQIDAAKSKLLARDRDTAMALDAKLSKATTSHVDKKSGKRIFDAYAGFDTETIALFAMYPSTLKIRKGDVVRWHFSTLVLENHTATFPFDRGLEIANSSFNPACDPDGDQGQGPDQPADFSGQAPPCADMTQLEFDLTNALTGKLGDGRFDGKGVESSGLRGPWAPLGQNSWDVQFTKASVTAAKPSKGFKYVCAFHGREMTGKVIVR